MKHFVRPLRVLILTLVSYLLDVCVMRHLYIGSVTASACLAGIAIITVSYGKKAAFCAGCIIGILMECMLSSVPVLYLLSYPIITMLCAQWFEICPTVSANAESWLSRWTGRMGRSPVSEPCM